MKKSMTVLLCMTSTMLVLGSIHSIFADEAVTDTHIDVPYAKANDKDSRYKIHVQIEVRNSDNQLVAVTETTGGIYLDHKVTDKSFNTSLGKKEIVTVDNIKYEKVQFGNTVQAINFFGDNQALVGGLWIVQTCDQEFIQFGNKCLNFLQSRTNQLPFEGDDIIKSTWTVLRTMN